MESDGVKRSTTLRHDAPTLVCVTHKGRKTRQQKNHCKVYVVIMKCMLYLKYQLCAVVTLWHHSTL